jgi:hypothetical protein
MNELSVAILERALTAKAITRADVVNFEKRIMEHPAHLTAKDFTVRHHFAYGVYMRELHIPKDMIVVGKIHKYPCLALLSKGKMELLVDGEIVKIAAPRVMVSPAGIKRVGRALEDSIFITAHGTFKTDADEIERDLSCDTEQEYQEFLTDMARPCLS